MICAAFLTRNGVLCGFDLQGHAGTASAGRNIVCAAVSSAAYMAANTLTEVCGCRADITEADGTLRIAVAEPDTDKARETLEGFRLHLGGLAAQYPKEIQIQQTEV